MGGQPGDPGTSRDAQASELRRRIGCWEPIDATPAGMADVLRVARELLIGSVEVHEFSLVAATWSLLALEACLRDCLEEPKAGLHALIERARDERLLTDEEARALQGSRRLRNTIVHGALIPTYSAEAAVQMVQSIEEAICDLYQRAAQS